jgi:hypothetical protein
LFRGSRRRPLEPPPGRQPSPRRPRRTRVSRPRPRAPARPPDLPAADPNLGVTERQLKKQGLECLVAILRSLVTWGTVAAKPAEPAAEPTTRARMSEDTRVDTLTPDPSRDRLSLSYPDGTPQPQPSPTPTGEIQDDPTRFENAKLKKTTLTEGIRKFNAKPKKVRARFGWQMCAADL